MGVILKSEEKTFKARVFLALIYLVLSLGAVTMVYPFLVMITASVSSNYDYQRHSPFTRALFNPADRYMRFLATEFRRFPREVFPEAPESWTTWAEIAKDREGVEKLYANRGPAQADGEWLKGLTELPPEELVCNYDAREVAGFLKRKYGTVEKLNEVWPVPHQSFFDVSFQLESRGKAMPGPKLDDWNEFARGYVTEALNKGDAVCRTMPKDLAGNAAAIRGALNAQFEAHGWRDFWQGMAANYKAVGDYLFVRGRAFVNTIILVVLSVLASLTVNPLAAYALSRFKLKGTEKIILFLLSTMAFPAAVTAIPGFLLIRDLGLLNTFAALVLPGIASGMSIFILKGFFDALPRELYEAAAIDGAGEWTVFFRITLPMTTPILAVNALNSFIHAYSSWEWAFLVCQNESHWTLAVWMYQMSQTFAHQPWCVMAGFVLVSIPTAVVFLACQRVILRGIVLPSMK